MWVINAIKMNEKKSTMYKNKRRHRHHYILLNPLPETGDRLSVPMTTTTKKIKNGDKSVIFFN